MSGSPNDMLRSALSSANMAISTMRGKITYLECEVSQLRAELSSYREIVRKQYTAMKANDLLSSEDDALDVVKSTLDEYPHVTMRQLLGRTRTRDISKVRIICMARVRKACPSMSYPEIARMFARDNHTTVVHAVKVARERGWVE